MAFSLFGGGDYGAGGYRNAYQNTLGQENGVANQFGGIGASAGADYGRLNAGYTDALSRYADLLGQDKYTDSYSTAAINHATSGTTAAYQAARANLAKDMNERGFGGAPSSIGAGADASIEAGRAGQIGNAQNELALDKINSRYTNEAALTNLYGSAAGQAGNRQLGALGQEGGLLHDVSGGELNLYQDAEAKQRQQAEGIMNLIGTGAGLAGSIWGGPAGGAAAKAITGGGGGPHTLSPQALWMQQVMGSGMI